MRGTDNQNVCPPIVGGYTHWTFRGLFQASGLALFHALYVVCYTLLVHMGRPVVFLSFFLLSFPPRCLHVSIRFYFF